MSLWSTASLALAAWCLGPPLLPPVPGEQPPAEDAAADTPSTPATSARTSPAVAGTAPEPKTETKTKTARPDQGQPEPPSATSRPPGAFSVPENVEPPQPETGQPAPSQVATNAKPSEPDRRAPPTSAPRLGEDPTTPPGPVLVFPPPARPPYRGLGLFIAAGSTFAIALTEQIIAHRLVKRRCIDPISRADYEGGDDVSEVAATCAPGVLPALALRVHSDLSLIATIGLATAGAMTRANAEAYGDVFDRQRRREHTGVRIAGVSLLGVGIVSWLSTGVASWSVLGSCGTARCVNRARIMAFTTRDVSVAMVAAGGGMLAFSEMYRRRHDRYTRDRALSVGPVVSGTRVGFTLGGSF